MKLISHRGNINGKNMERENNPYYINETISFGYDVEIDLWCIDNELYLGHDNPSFKIDKNWIISRYSNLWIHSKNIKSLYFLKELNKNLNYFYHQNDDVTITSKGFFWTYPGKELTNNSIAVMPEISAFENIENCFGICSDFISNYRILLDIK